MLFLIVKKFFRIEFADEEAFYQTSIESIIIPSQVEQIEKDAFGDCELLQIIEIKEDSKLEYIDKNMFQKSEHFILMIPANLSDHFKL